MVVREALICVEDSVDWTDTPKPVTSAITTKSNGRENKAKKFRKRKRNK